jgi:predicted short-subunit dehydrogenase-like oxidoreductase (DUF2520 family)
VERLVFVGPGRVGLALGYALVQADAVSSLVYHGRRPEPPEHPLFHQGAAEYRYGLEAPEPGTTAVFLTVPDQALAEIAMALASRGDPSPGCPVFHCSGALGAEPLAPLHARGYRVGSLHPLQAIANPVVGADRLIGAAFALSGEHEALATARRLVGILGGRGITIPTGRRPLYHAAAVLASNYVVVLLREASRLFQAAGASEEDAEAALLGLARGAIENAASLGLDRALTGPVARGDVDVVGLHLRTLETEDAELYALLGERALAEVRDTLPPDAAGALEELFRRYR